MTDAPPPLTFHHLADPVLDQLGQHTTSAYVETFWLPIIGPTSLCLLRHVTTRTTGTPYRVDADTLALSLGLGRGIGKNAPLARTLDRLRRFELAATGGEPGTWWVRHHLAPLSARYLGRLPASLRAEHDQLAASWRAA